MVMIGHFDCDLMFPRSESVKGAFESILILGVDKGVHVVAFRPFSQGIRQFNRWSQNVAIVRRGNPKLRSFLFPA